MLPQEAMAHADAVVQGEGEPVWRELLDDFENGRLQPLYVAKQHQLEQSPVPRYDLLDPARYNRLTLQTVRGCPLDCSFCAASRLISSFKVKPLDQVRRELEAILAVWPRPFIELADDNTFVNKKWAKQLARLLGEYRVRWFTESDISLADDEELLELLAASGCAQVLIGLESPSLEALSQVDSKGWKARRRDRYIESVEKIQAHGISVNGCFVLGHDEDGPDVFQRTYDFVSEARLSEVQVTVLTPFPGTRLYARLKSEGRLLRHEFWDKCTLFDVVYRPKHMSVQELEDGFHGLVRDLYMEAEVERRKTSFRACLRRAKRQALEAPTKS
jgi:radical SAM superfamily enzyme YgiQ (UPF0313 family)